jgi:hypothetical protein
MEENPAVFPPGFAMTTLKQKRYHWRINVKTNDFPDFYKAQASWRTFFALAHGVKLTML